MSDPFSGLLTPPTFAHAHHTHTHSYGGGGNGADGGSFEFMDMLSARAEAEHQHAHGHSREDSGQYADPYAGGGAHLSAHQSGLQPDPNAHGVVRGTAGAAQGSVGRFVVVEGSPMHRGEEETERNAPSPFPLHESEMEGEDGQGRDGEGDGDEDAAAQEDEDDQAERLRQEQRQAQARQQQRHQHRHPQHQRHDSFPREFYVPRFPSMQVNGASVELRLAISTLPLHSVTISPSAQGLEFSPPKLKWTPDSGALDRLFTAVPLATAREGKCKVSYIVGGDDAAEYSEPGPSVLHMYSEDTALPLPSPPAEYTPSSLNSSRSNVFSPHSDIGSDSGTGPASARSSGGGMQMQQQMQQHSKSDRASFLAQGQPRQSGRFTVTDEVIDEELQGSPSNGASASPSASPPALGSDDPLDLLSRLHASMAAIMADNERLQQENARLMQENAELRQRDSSYAPEDGRFNRYTPSPSPQPPIQQQQPHQQSHRTAHISAQPLNVSAPPPKQRFGSGGGGVFPQSNSLSRPPSSASLQHSSPPSVAVGSGFMAGKQPVVMSNDKRATLPANFHAAQRNAHSAAGSGQQHRGSMPPQQQPQQLYQSHTASPSPMSSPPSARRSSTPRDLHAQQMQQQQQLHVQVSPPRLDGGVRAKLPASGTASPSGQARRKNSIDFQHR